MAFKLITCPQCKRQISVTVWSCPVCGYVLAPMPLKPSSLLDRKIGPGCIFMIILSLIILGIFFISKQESKNFNTENIRKETDYRYKITIVSWEWEKEERYNYIRGRIRNDGDKIIKYFKIKAFYLDENDNVLDTDIDNDTETLSPGMAKEFEIIHKNNSEYKKVRLEIVEVNIQD